MASEKPLSCNEVEDFLPFLVMGALDQSTRGLVVSHLAGCSDCMEGLKQTVAFRDTVSRQLSALPEPPLEVFWAVKQRTTSAAGPRDALRSFVFETLMPEVASAFMPEAVWSLVETVKRLERRVAHARI